MKKKTHRDSFVWMLIVGTSRCNFSTSIANAITLKVMKWYSSTTTIVQVLVVTTYCIKRGVALICTDCDTKLLLILSIGGEMRMWMWSVHFTKTQWLCVREPRWWLHHIARMNVQTENASDSVWLSILSFSLYLSICSCMCVCVCVCSTIHARHFTFD